MDDIIDGELPELTDELEALGIWREGERLVSRDEAFSDAQTARPAEKGRAEAQGDAAARSGRGGEVEG